MSRESAVLAGFQAISCSASFEKAKQGLNIAVLGFGVMLVQFGGGVVCPAQSLARSDKPCIQAGTQLTEVSRPAAASATLTVSTLTASGSDPYNLTCNVVGGAVGGASAPGGSVAFTDITTGQALGSAALQAGGTGRDFQQAGTFAAASSFMAAGDFNGDGIPDLVLDGPNAALLQIELGTGGGNYQAGPQITVPLGPDAVVEADFNRDGKLDLAVVSEQCCLTGHYLGGSVSILLGNGDGTFQSPVQLATIGLSTTGGGTGDAIIAVDLNNDGIPDIAAPDPSSNSVMVILGNGDGTFRPVQRYAVGITPFKLAVGDFNKDGKSDLVVANWGDQTLSVLLGNGDGTFKAQSVVPLSFPPKSILTGDFNRDGLLDAVVSGNTQTLLMLGNGDGTFQSVNVGITTWPAVAVGDVTGDGVLDIISAELTNTGRSGPVMIYPGNGDGTFQAPESLNTGVAAIDLLVTDLNGDGILDLVASGTDSSSVFKTSVMIGYNAASAQGKLANATVNVGTAASHNLECSFPGDSDYSASTSNPVVETYAPAPTPQFSPLIGVYPPGETVTVTDTLAGTVLDCTSDGSTPTSSSGACGSSITLNATTTLKAIAVGVGYLPSAVSTATYTIQQTGGTYGLQTPALSVAKGAGGMATVTVSSTNTYVGTVSLSCSVTSSPSGAVNLPSCSPESTVTLTSNTTSATTTLTINTTAASGQMAAATGKPGEAWKTGASILAGCVVLFAVPRRRVWSRVLVMLVLLVAALPCIQGCGSSSTKPMGNPGSTPGAYVITITGSGSDTAKTAATTAFTLTVQ